MSRAAFLVGQMHPIARGGVLPEPGVSLVELVSVWDLLAYNTVTAAFRLERTRTPAESWTLQSRMTRSLLIRRTKVPELTTSVKVVVRAAILAIE